MAWFQEQRVFWREFLQNFHTTGAILPSGRQLSRSLAHFAALPGPPRRILEVGPGTGPVTAQLAGLLRPDDRLDLVELNDRFVEQLRRRFDSEPRFQQIANQTRILHQPVQSLTAETPYDVIISGLPLNNFSVVLVEEILQKFDQLLAPNGTLSFFEYAAIRHFKRLLANRAERQRLDGISEVLAKLLAAREMRRDLIWLNLPPAWVHHISGPSGGQECPKP